MGMRKRLQSSSGQMTVELAVVLPVLIIVAVIVTNALMFFRDCAVFDRVAHEAVRVHATSPAYGAGVEQSCALVEQEIRRVFDNSNVDVEVEHVEVGVDLDRYCATLTFTPTLFGRGLRSRVFGVELPRLNHSSIYIVDRYRPGVIA